MYALFAYVGGEWGFAGVDPHEECAVLFIDYFDNKFGDGTAQVFKFPDKSEHNPTADAAEQHLSRNNLQEMLEALEAGNATAMDAELAKFFKGK